LRIATKCVVFYRRTGEPTEDLFPGHLVQNIYVPL